MEYTMDPLTLPMDLQEDIPAKAVREKIMFMWLAARQCPDFRTINRFRSERMKDVLETVFTAVLPFLAEQSYVITEAQASISH